MNSDAPYESAVRTSLIPLHRQKNWGQLPSPLCKVEGAKLVLSPFVGIKLKRIKTFYFDMEAYCQVPQGYKVFWTRVCFETTDFFFYCCTVWKYIFCTFFVHMRIPLLEAPDLFSIENMTRFFFTF